MKNFLSEAQTSRTFLWPWPLCKLRQRLQRITIKRSPQMKSVEPGFFGWAQFASQISIKVLKWTIPILIITTNSHEHLLELGMILKRTFKQTSQLGLREVGVTQDIKWARSFKTCRTSLSMEFFDKRGSSHTSNKNRMRLNIRTTAAKGNGSLARLHDVLTAALLASAAGGRDRASEIYAVAEIAWRNQHAGIRQVRSAARWA